MDMVILIPAIAACFLLARRSAASALMNVWLPALMLLPDYYVLRIKHIPPITFADSAVLPLGIAMIVLLAQRRLRWTLRRADLWVILFIVLSAISETLHTNSHTGGFDLFDGICTALLPYMAGRLLMEKYGLRLKFVARFIVLLAVVAVFSVYDFDKGVSSTQEFWSHFFPGQAVPQWAQQLRWGYGRIAGPYAHAILCGLMFLAGIVLCLWLRRAYPSWGRRRIVAFLPVELRTLALTALIAGLLMTQSRGPWLGVLFAVAVVWVGRQRFVRRAAWKLTFAALAIFLMSYGMVTRYTSGSLQDAHTVAQRDAVYRRELLPDYMPVVMERPLLGWGGSAYPKVHGLDSIDDEYLLLAVTNGLVGLALFLLMNLENVRALILATRAERNPANRAFLFALMGILGGLLFTLTTVFLGMQVFQLFFLLSGWIQALRPVRVAAPYAVPAATGPQYRFRRVLC